MEYLKKETGFNIKQIFPDTFDEHMRMVGQGKVDISFTNPYVYVKTAYRYGEKAFAQVIEDSGLKSFRGQIICRADNSSIQTIQDCKGKRLIAVDLTSAGGYLYPMGLFSDHGIRQEDFAEVDFSHGPGGKQEKVILAVYVGQYDIGLIREGARTWWPTESISARSGWSPTANTTPDGSIPPEKIWRRKFFSGFRRPCSNFPWMIPITGKFCKRRISSVLCRPMMQNLNRFGN